MPPSPEHAPRGEPSATVFPVSVVRPAAAAAGDGPAGCAGCAEGEALGFDITMAFQPILDVPGKRVFGYEALVRGTAGESAAQVLARVNDANRYAFDQRCRTRAIELACRHGISTEADTLLSINFLPNAVYRPEVCIRATLKVANRLGFPLDRLMFEVSETERTMELAHLKDIFQKYRALGFRTALDDFGAGHSGLALLVELQPDVVKVDMALVRGIEASAPRRAVLRALVGLCDELGTALIAEGVETREETQALRDLGVRLFQGYFFGRPLVR